MISIGNEQSLNIPGLVQLKTSRRWTVVRFHSVLCGNMNRKSVKFEHRNVLGYEEKTLGLSTLPSFEQKSCGILCLCLLVTHAILE